MNAANHAIWLLPKAPLAATLCLAVGVAAVLACTSPPPLLSRAPLAVHQAYVWQHAWGPAMTAAVRERLPELQSLRVLAVTYGPDGRARPAAVDVQALEGTGPVVAVARIEGKAGLVDATLLPLKAIVTAWQAAGVQVTGVEVDHDCPTAQLARYTSWLLAHKSTVAPLPIGITALPTWRGSPHLAELAQAADSVTLQVHTIAAPALFDAQAARTACDGWGAATGKAFWVALPTYRARLTTGQELTADPSQLQEFVASLRSNPPPGLLGAVWFRLPYQGDPEAWASPTWRAVLRGEPLTAAISLELRPAGAGLWDIVASNAGTAAGPLPVAARFGGAVAHLEGARGCRAQGAVLRCPDARPLGVARTVVIGYVRGQDVQVFER